MPSSTTPHCSPISPHPHPQTLLPSPNFPQKTLPHLSQQHPHLFPHFQTHRFPFLTKILHPNHHLSLHLHPHHHYPNNFQNPQL
ncbi:type I phosphomannose isomerase catalytic subunit, partial [Priestia megaterium]|uniref:type I phosphomannose isomerase catalytic subunit n=1 Tax=Priestia megaterium TaxID=1404 RepID=UPI0039A15642